MFLFGDLDGVDDISEEPPVFRRIVVDAAASPLYNFRYRVLHSLYEHMWNLLIDQRASAAELQRLNSKFARLIDIQAQFRSAEPRLCRTHEALARYTRRNGMQPSPEDLYVLAFQLQVLPVQIIEWFQQLAD
jgi:hypothetical protein